MLKFILVYYFLGPIFFSFSLLTLLFAPEQIVPMWPIYPFLIGTFALLLYSQLSNPKWIRKIYSQTEIKIAKIIGLISGLAIGPIIVFSFMT